MKRWNWAIAGQWITIAIILIGVLIQTERRLTTVEAAVHQQIEGYNIIIHEFRTRLDRFDDKLDRLAERR